VLQCLTKWNLFRFIFTIIRHVCIKRKEHLHAKVSILTNWTKAKFDNVPEVKTWVCFFSQTFIQPNIDQYKTDCIRANDNWHTSLYYNAKYTKKRTIFRCVSYLLFFSLKYTIYLDDWSIYELIFYAVISLKIMSCFATCVNEMDFS